LVEPVGMVDVAFDESEKVDDLVWWPANDESQTHDHWRHSGITPGFVDIFCRSHLKFRLLLLLLLLKEEKEEVEKSTKHKHDICGDALYSMLVECDEQV